MLGLFGVFRAFHDTHEPRRRGLVLDMLIVVVDLAHPAPLLASHASGGLAVEVGGRSWHVAPPLRIEGEPPLAGVASFCLPVGRLAGRREGGCGLVASCGN